VEKTAPGAMILLPAGTRDRLRWEGGSERVVGSVEPELLQRVGGELGVMVTSEFEAQWALQSASLGLLVREMGREAAEGWPLGVLYADLLAMSLSKQLLGRHTQLPLLRGGMTMPRLRRAMDFMHERLGGDLRLEEVASALGVSPFYFAHEFRESTGQTPYQYLLDLRMERAKRLLRETAWPLQEIAAQVGFASAVNFGRAFRQRVGVTPGAWRAG
jgi:AraC family transcriptional regulator